MFLALLLLQGGGASSLLPILFMGAMLAVIYFFMIRPQMTKEREAKSYLDTVTVGQKVITSGGIHGTVTRVDDTVLSVQIAPTTTVKVEKDAIAVEKTRKLNTAATTNASA